jgi:2'-5' RNA ligase
MAITRIERLVRDLRDAHGHKGKPLGAGRFHLSLHHVGDYPSLRQDVVDAACKAAAAVTAMAPFKLGFDRVASFKRPRNMPLVLLGNDGLIAAKAFQQALATALAGAGCGRGPDPRHAPHLPLLYTTTTMSPHTRSSPSSGPRTNSFSCAA